MVENTVYCYININFLTPILINDLTDNPQWGKMTCNLYLKLQKYYWYWCSIKILLVIHWHLILNICEK